MSNNNSKKIILAVLVVVLLVVVVRQYLPMIQLPTEGRLQEKLQELKSLRSDLAVAKKTLSIRQQEIVDMRKLTDSFWVPSENVAKVDQEINSEFNRIARMAQVSGVAGTQKVDLGREKPGSFLQDVTISADFRNISMQDMSRLMEQLRLPRNKGRFRWEYCKITPDNPRTPKAMNVSVRFKVLALNDDALTCLGFREETPAPSATRPAAAGPTGFSRKK